MGEKAVKAIGILAMLVMAGCEQPKKEVKLPPNQSFLEARSTYRAERFAECMRLLPAGPESTKYNDWDEVVEACSTTSWYLTNERYPQ